MNAKLLVSLALVFLATVSRAQKFRVTEDRDLKELDLSAWDCRDPGGTAKTADGVERNTLKNRAPIELSGVRVENFDTAGFLKRLSAFEALTKNKRRKELAPPEREQLAALEKQVVSLTAYMVLAYAGPPETTNCGSVDYHDWHLELFEKPQDHVPQIGDPTPIICEITPHAQNTLLRDGVSIQKLTGFFRGPPPEMPTESTGHPPQRVKITGFLLWDDEHNGKADVGTSVERVLPNKYHQPWRSTAWEIHPILKIEPADNAPVALATPSAAAATASVAAPATTSPAQEVTIIAPVKVKIPYGETVLQRGMKFRVISRDAQNVRVNYMGQTIDVPLQSTDLH